MLNDQPEGNAMLNDLEPESTHQLSVYQIRVKGHLDSDWTDWFEGLSVIQEGNGETLISGPVVDQAALHGLLKKIRDLGMLLISVNCLEPTTAIRGSGHVAVVDDQP